MFKILILPIFTLFAGLLFAATNPVSEKHGNAYPEELPGTFTGGFGEDSCHSCHFDYPLNPDDGSLSLVGFPKQYEPGKAYIFAITLSREKLGQGGFQLSSRFEDGSQAGSFELNSEHLSFTETEKNATIQYIQHSLKGSKVNNQTSIRWKVKWEAPDSAAGNIIFNIAANAANGDASAFGDFIYTREVRVSPKQ